MKDTMEETPILPYTGQPVTFKDTSSVNTAPKHVEQTNQPSTSQQSSSKTHPLPFWDTINNPGNTPPVESYTTAQPKITKFLKKIPNEAVTLQEKNIFHKVMETVKDGLDEIDEVINKFTSVEEDLALSEDDDDFEAAVVTLEDIIMDL